MSKAVRLSDQVLAEIREHFDFFDEDHNGRIDLQEFARLLRVLSCKTTDAEAAVGFQLIDEDHSGYVDFDEFIAWWRTCWWEYIADPEGEGDGFGPESEPPDAA